MDSGQFVDNNGEIGGQDNQKLENLLNLALDATDEEREKSGILGTGYDTEEDTWELIVKFHGSAAEIRNFLGEAGDFEELYGFYGIARVPTGLVDAFSALEMIEYVEKPKRLYFADIQANRVSCITQLQTTTNAAGFEQLYLSGAGVLVAVIDSGIDYTHPDFRNDDGTTRIVELWDQTVSQEMTPRGIATDSTMSINAATNVSITSNVTPSGTISSVGTVFTSSQINEALRSMGGDIRATVVSTEQRNRAYEIVPSRDITGHGTAVAGIAAGNGRASGRLYLGVATHSELLVVKLGTPGVNTFPRTTELMRAINFCVRRAVELSRPIAINLSFGNTYGSHIGDSLLETYIDTVSGIGRNVICIGTGNEGAAGGHTGGVLREGQNVLIELAVAEQESTLSVQLWKGYEDTFSVRITAPSGETLLLPEQQGALVSGVLNPGAWEFVLDQTKLLVLIGRPTPYSESQEVFIDMIPVGGQNNSLETEATGESSYVASGIWTIELIPERIVTGLYRLYLPSENVLNRGTRFRSSTPEFTLTIPSTAGEGIAVAAYNSIYDSYADFSGRGSSDGSVALNAWKPDLAAPGVDVMSTNAGGGYETYTGTSFATPFVTGGAALLMEWGIVKGNDSFLYGQKVKAYLKRGARQLPGLDTPNPLTGWGALCVSDSLPI